MAEDKIINEEVYEVPEYKGTSSKESPKQEALEHTVAFKAQDKEDKKELTVEIAPAAEETVAFTKVEENIQNTDTIEHTRHFSLKSNKKNKNKSFIQNFRVLSKDKEDRAILEAAPSGKGGKAFADTVKAEEGEDIFEAVEKAYLEREEANLKSVEDDAAAKKEALKKQHEEKGKKKAEEVKSDYEKKAGYSKIGVYAQTVIFAISLVTTLFFSGNTLSMKINFVLIIFSCVFSFKALWKSIRQLKGLHCIADISVLIMAFFSIFHASTAFILGEDGALFALPLSLCCLLRNGAEYFKSKNLLRYISLAIKSKSLSVLQGINVKTEGNAFSKNTDSDEANIFYCGKAYLDTAIEKNKYDTAKENKYYTLSICLVFLAALIIGFLNFFQNKTGFSFITALTATICSILPVIYDPLSRYFLYYQSDYMFKNGAAVSGREALSPIRTAEGYVFETADVFSGEVFRFRRSAISRISQSDSAVFAAIVLSAGGSILAPCFDSFIEELGITLPEAENIQYEERLGYSAWVMDRKILVGNRQMLISHSIDVPSQEHEKAYGKGRFVMYVVIDGEITATFLVSYKVLASLKKYARDFNRTGLVLMLSSREPFLSEQYVATKLSVEIAAVKVLSSKATSIMEKYNSNREDNIPTGLICSKKKRSFMHLIMGSYNLCTYDRLIYSLSISGQLLGFVLLVAATAFKIPIVLHPVAAVFFKALWSGLIILLLKIKTGKQS